MIDYWPVFLADVIVMDPKLSKLVKNAVKVGKKEKKKKIGAKAHKAHGK